MTHLAGGQIAGYLRFLREQFVRAPRLMWGITLSSAFARMLETMALILPLKGVFVLLNPAILPEALTGRGVGVEELMVFLAFAAVFSFLLSRLLNVLAHRWARQVTLAVQSGQEGMQTRLTVRLTSSSLVLLIFTLAIFWLYYPAALLILGLMGVTLVFPARVSESRAWTFLLASLGGQDEVSARYRLLASSLFLVFFIVLIVMILWGGLAVSASLLFTVLIGRRLLQEYGRLRISIVALEALLKGNPAVAGQADPEQ